MKSCIMQMKAKWKNGEPRRGSLNSCYEDLKKPLALFAASRRGIQAMLLMARQWLKHRMIIQTPQLHPATLLNTTRRPPLRRAVCENRRTERSPRTGCIRAYAQFCEQFLVRCFHLRIYLIYIFAPLNHNYRDETNSKYRSKTYTFSKDFHQAHS